MKIVIILGCRPEVIKLFPVLLELDRMGIEHVVISTGQHSDLLRQTLDTFGIAPDYDLCISWPNQSLGYITSSILSKIEEILNKELPDVVIVQGDTNTAFAGALSAFYQQIPVAHVEAGLRTFDISQPFPEEANRVMIDALSSFLFAPTEEAASNLGYIDKDVYITGNTEIDALYYSLDNMTPSEQFLYDEDIVLVTAHRRESFGRKMGQIAAALDLLGKWHNGIKIMVMVHPNPNVKKVLTKISGPKIELLGPMDFVSFTHLMARSKIILTDSGGVQEDAAALGVPVLVLRDKTERKEGIKTGAAKLVGTDTNSIVDNTIRLLEDEESYNAMARAGNPYGDGNAARRIVDILKKHC